MKVYHQTGFRFIWNIDSYIQGVGDGLIFSPVNISSDELESIDESIKKSSFLDPQLYLPSQEKGQLITYNYFPLNFIPGFTTIALHSQQDMLAKECVDIQVRNDFEYIVIPCRYYDEFPTNYFDNQTEFYIDPFCKYISTLDLAKKILITVVVKPIMLTDVAKRDDILNWITSQQNIDGIYLIFENNFLTKQIKDVDFLFGALQFIDLIKFNGLEVHIGYCNVEGLLYSAANPDSITIGSYENLRHFKVKRFEVVEKQQMKGPNARIYSGLLCQWIDYSYLASLKALYPNYNLMLEDSDFKLAMFEASYKWHFSKPQPYKHFFKVFYDQTKLLPVNQDDRIPYLKTLFSKAIDEFEIIKNKVRLDPDSDGSHLYIWLNVLSMYEDFKNNS
ncbi:hypothetical protein [Larkinella sp.]|uniref:hypothetical protein n=1 Tax=Larkinella sp. TaxID=2034517 RepID=UPI003BAA98A9